MKRHINNPYKLNWKMYTLIGVVSVSVMTFAVIHNNATGSTVSDNSCHERKRKGKQITV